MSEYDVGISGLRTEPKTQHELDYEEEMRVRNEIKDRDGVSDNIADGKNIDNTAKGYFRTDVKEIK